MKIIQCMIVPVSMVLAVGCNKEKSAINEDRNNAIEEIDARKSDVDAAAKEAKKQTTANAEIDKARIEADKDSMKAQLDADKKKVDAEAEAAKAKVDAEKK